MPIYKCEFCKFQTEKKTDFQRHKDRKVPCTLSQLAKRESELESKIETAVEERLKAKELLQMAAEAVPKQLNEIIDLTKNLVLTPSAETEAITQPTQVDVTILMTLNKRIHNMIRNFQGNLKSDKIHHDVSRMFFYVFAQNYYETRLIDLFKLEHYKEVDGFEECYLKLLRINELLASENAVIEHNLKNLWRKVLAQHTLTKPAFAHSDFFNIKPELVKVCLFEIYKTIKNINFDTLNEDIKGKIFEYYVNEYSNSDSNDFGAYFTPRPLIKATLSLIKTLFPNFTPYNVYDPCMGTAGFLTEAYRAFKTSIDVGFVYGNELEPDTFTSAYMNMLLSVKPPAFTWCLDSFTDTTPNKFQLIVTNPPFGVDTNYDKIVEACNEQNKADPTKFSGAMMYPVKTNDGSALFLQHCMAKLANPGVCSIVLPNGEILTKAGAFSTLRQYLMINFYIMSIVTVPPGTFTNTKVNTVILTFANIGYATQSIKFYEYVNGETKFQEEIPLAKIIEKKYNWRYAQYRPFETIANASYPVVKLGDICEIKSGKTITKAEHKEGPYPVLGGGKVNKGFHNEYNIDENVICIARVGSAGYVSKTATKTFMSDGSLALINIRTDINNNYLYYYLQTVQDQIYALVGGSGVPAINKATLYEIPVPIPPMEKQIEITAVCDRIAYVKKFIEVENDFNKEQMEYVKQHLSEKLMTEYPFVVKTINDICIFVSSGKRNSSEGKEQGLYPLYYCSILGYLYLDTYDEDTSEIIMNKTNGSGKCEIYLAEGKHSVAQSTLRIKPMDESINIKYLYYYLRTTKKSIETLYQGVLQKSITKENFGSFPIYVPSIDDQLKIVDEFEKIIMANTNQHIERIEKNKKYMELLDSEVVTLFK
jgi:type I restriction-modification system DNA methylase subunit/restriction endonuclease S subunit